MQLRAVQSCYTNGKSIIQNGKNNAHHDEFFYGSKQVFIHLKKSHINLKANQKYKNDDTDILYEERFVSFWYPELNFHTKARILLYFIFTHHLYYAVYFTFHSIYNNPLK